MAILNAFRPTLDNVDLGWHIAQGRWMVHHLAFYRTDVLNYPTAGHPVVDEYVFFQIGLYLSYLCGWWGPCVLCALGYILLLAILVLTGRAVDLGASSALALMIGAMLLFLNIAFPLRPHLVTFLGIAAFGSFLLRHREAASWTRFWPLALVQIVWTNCHSGFVLGPVMVALFGVEMTARRWLRSRVVPWSAMHVWTAATVLVFLGCFANPYGVLRFGAPFYQEHLEAIRAYVGEMQPLNPGAASAYGHVVLWSAAIIGLAVFLRRGAISWSFLLLAVVFYFEALHVKKAWPVFGIFLPLLVLSCGAFARTTITRRKGVAWFSATGHLLVVIVLVCAIWSRLDGESDASLAVQWHEWDLGRTELPVDAVAWLKQSHVTGRILHRCEDGGLLQQEGIVPTFADTGFGKYDEAFIRETGLLGMNPDLLPAFLQRYQPHLVVCDGFAFRWPAYLIRSGWYPVSYSPNSSVWSDDTMKRDLSVHLPQVEQTFTADIQKNGLPRNMTLYGRDIIALNSMGDSAFAVAQLSSLPADMHRADWYWEAARIMCFQYPGLPADLRAKLRQEADSVGDSALDFRAYDEEDKGNLEAARQMLEKKAVLSDVEATLLLRIDLKQNRPEALALARQKLYDLTNGERWMALAVLEEKAGNLKRAGFAWNKMLYYAPEEDFRAATTFFQAHPELRTGPDFIYDPKFAAPTVPGSDFELN